MSAKVIRLADHSAARRQRLFDHGHSVSNDGRDYGHELCPRCLGATYTGRHIVCPICGAHACVCYNGKRMTLDEYFDEFLVEPRQPDGPEAA